MPDNEELLQRIEAIEKLMKDMWEGQKMMMEYSRAQTKLMKRSIDIVERLLNPNQK